jgi:hypothetical protein
VQSSNSTKVVSNKSVPAQQFDVQVGKGQKARVTLGFTKSNELFVGRVAMLGAVPDNLVHSRLQ